jgi:signal transduction histidine kinase
MAMQSSNELQETAALLFREFRRLGAEDMYQVTIGIYDEESQLIDFRVTSWAGSGEQESRSFQLDMQEPTVLQPAVRAWKDHQKSVVIDLSGEALEGWLQYRNKMSGISVSSADTGGRRVISAAFYSKGHLSISTREPVSAETLRTLERFAAVFDATYTRFQDLQKAEAQAREARIEASLERVRSRTLAMQKSDELAETAAVLFHQLIALGIEPNRLYIILIKENIAEMEAWVTDEDGSSVSMGFTGNYNHNGSLYKMYEGWKEKRTSLVIDMQGEELQQYFHYLHDELHVPFKGGLDQKRRVQHIAYFSHGLIGMASPEEQPVETLQLMERFAAVFNLTFTRFNDLKLAEAHAAQAELDLIAIKEAKQKAEEALIELQATQKQLIQSEKMASLGELTAGIAHEIQNPLNFVNNFSEVSKELLDEIRTEMEKGNLEDAKEIMQDVIQNLEKIHHHGKRADGIVKGMLQHSRTGSGQMEATDINVLCDEYLRLSYHGLRAKDKSFNARFETHFDPSVGKVNVLPQDLGRVVLNLINNAFYAVAERKKSGEAAYDPTVIVRTSRSSLPEKGGGGEVTISVKDNGAGIPKSILDKIFQPFFTTKPTGQGTGLGLSLSYDIVKAHGGELKVETKEGEGTEFIIVLPIARITD